MANGIITARIRQLEDKKSDLLSVKKSERGGQLRSVTNSISRLKQWNKTL